MCHTPTVLVCKYEMKVWKGSNLMSDHGILCTNLQAIVTQLETLDQIRTLTPYSCGTHM